MTDTQKPQTRHLACYDIIAELPQDENHDTRLVARWTSQMHPGEGAANEWARIELAEAVFAPESPAAKALLTPITKEDLARISIFARRFRP